MPEKKNYYNFDSKEKVFTFSKPMDNKQSNFPQLKLEKGKLQIFFYEGKTLTLLAELKKFNSGGGKIETEQRDYEFDTGNQKAPHFALSQSQSQSQLQSQITYFFVYNRFMVENNTPLIQISRFYSLLQLAKVKVPSSEIYTEEENSDFISFKVELLRNLLMKELFSTKPTETKLVGGMFKMNSQKRPDRQVSFELPGISNVDLNNTGSDLGSETVVNTDYNTQLHNALSKKQQSNAIRDRGDEALWTILNQFENVNNPDSDRNNGAISPNRRRSSLDFNRQSFGQISMRGQPGTVRLTRAALERIFSPSDQQNESSSTERPPSYHTDTPPPSPRNLINNYAEWETFLSNNLFIQKSPPTSNKESVKSNKGPHTDNSKASTASTASTVSTASTASTASTTGNSTLSTASTASTASTGNSTVSRASRASTTGNNNYNDNEPNIQPRRFLGKEIEEENFCTPSLIKMIKCIYYSRNNMKHSEFCHCKIKRDYTGNVALNADDYSNMNIPSNGINTEKNNNTIHGNNMNLRIFLMLNVLDGVDYKSCLTELDTNKLPDNSFVNVDPNNNNNSMTDKIAENKKKLRALLIEINTACSRIYDDFIKMLKSKEGDKPVEILEKFTQLFNEKASEDIKFIEGSDNELKIKKLYELYFHIINTHCELENTFYWSTGTLGGGRDNKNKKGGFFSMEQVDKLLSENKIKLNTEKNEKLKELTKIRNIYLEKEKFFKKKKLNKKKFNTNIVFFNHKKTLLVIYTEFIFKDFLIPIKNYNIYKKKNKELDIKNKNILDFENKYKIETLSSDDKYKNLTDFILKRRKLDKQIVVIKNNLKKYDKASNEYKNKYIELYKQIKKDILEYEFESINKYPEINKYLKEKINYNNDILFIKNYYNKLQEKINKYKTFYQKIENKKKNFYTLNNLNIIYLQFIKNEIEILNIFNIKLDKKTNTEYRKNIKKTYTFYYIFKKKFTVFLDKLNKKKDIINEDFKTLYIIKNDLDMKFQKTVFMNEKEILLEDIKKNNITIYFFKLIYYNINLIIELIEDIINKSDYMLYIIEYFMTYLKNYNKICNILELIVNEKELLKNINQSNIKLDIVVKQQISSKDLKKILIICKIYNKYIYLNRKKLMKRKKEINQRYNNIIKDTFNLGNDIKKTKLIINEDMENSIKQEKIKKLRKLERNKLKFEDFLADIINLNGDYLLLINPVHLLTSLGFITLNKKNKLIINKDKIIKIEDTNKINKLLKSLNILENHLNKFNNPNNIKPFIVNYPKNPIN